MKNHHQEHKYHQCEYSIKVLSMCSSRDQKIMAAPHPPAQEIFTAESFTLGRMRAMNAVKSFVQASAASTLHCPELG